MTEPKQSEGRDRNAASPVEDWEASGILNSGRKPGEEKTSKREVGGGQHGNVEEARMMQEEGMHPDPDDLQGPAGDPAEDKPHSSTYPA